MDTSTAFALSAVRQARQNAQQINGVVADLQEEVADLKSKLFQQLMHTAGLEAQREHLQSLGANAPSALQPSGKTFSKDGSVKTKLRMVYEVAFDQKGYSLGIRNPVEWRRN